MTLAPRPRGPNETKIMHPVLGVISITAGASALSEEIRGIYVGVSGNVTVTHPDGSSATYVNLAAGIWHPIGATHVTAATATDILGAKL